MIGRLRAYFAARRSREKAIGRDTAVLLLMHTAGGAWHEARRRRRQKASEEEADHWHGVMQEITRRTGYSYQPDTATRMLE